MMVDGRTRGIALGVAIVGLVARTAGGQPRHTPPVEVATTMLRAECVRGHLHPGVTARALGGGRLQVRIRDLLDIRDRVPQFGAVVSGRIVSIEMTPQPVVQPVRPCWRDVLLELGPLPVGRYTIFADLDVIPVRTEPRHAHAEVVVR